MSKQQRAAFNANLRAQPKPPLNQSVSELRAGFAALMATTVIPADVRRAPTVLGDRPAVLVEAEHDARTGTILYFHGGWFVVGSPETSMCVAANLVSRTGFSAVCLDYRLAPEHPFPAAIEDGVAAFRALLDNGIDASSIAFAGDSVGGGLCVTTCLMARAAGLPMPAAIVAFSPAADASRSGASMDSKDGIDPFFTREGLDPTSAMYLAGQDPYQDLLSPATLADLSGFPPLLLQVGTNEVLLDDSTRLAARALNAGVDVILDVTADVPHVFQAFVGLLDEADWALDRAALFLRQQLAAQRAFAGSAT
jgi:epsilon-lactone hydrolase